MTVRWMSLDEFRAGERDNPYAPEPAYRQPLKAVPESQYNLWLLGSFAYLISVANRRRKAVPGEVWMPAASQRRRARRRTLVRAGFGVGLLLLVLTAFGDDLAPLAFTVLVFGGLPLLEFASRRAGMRAWIDYRTGEVGVDDGLRTRRRGVSRPR